MDSKKPPRKSEATVTTTLSFDRAIYKQLKVLAVEEETTVRDLIRDAVDDYLKRRTKRGR